MNKGKSLQGEGMAGSVRIEVLAVQLFCKVRVGMRGGQKLVMAASAEANARKTGAEA
jgi:hypothetical protein